LNDGDEEDLEDGCEAGHAEGDEEGVGIETGFLDGTGEIRVSAGIGGRGQPHHLSSRRILPFIVLILMHLPFPPSPLPWRPLEVVRSPRTINDGGSERPDDKGVVVLGESPVRFSLVAVVAAAAILWKRSDARRTRRGRREINLVGLREATH
jgi:hypothetical protein